MRSLMLYVFCFSLFFSCRNNNTLAFKPNIFESKACTNCPQVSITIPKALENNKISKTINTALEEEIIALLLFNEDVEVNTIPDAIASFKKGFYEIQKQYTGENTIWEANIDAAITYEDVSILTIKLTAYLFTGGAHGYTSIRLLNFDKKKGNEIENRQLFKDMDTFEDYAETQFRNQENIPQNKPINDTGFMFDNNSFYLPENIGYTQEGLQLIYNQYEIASYAEGSIEILFPYTKIKKYLAIKTKN